MERDKEKNIDEILSSAKNAKPAEANPFLAAIVEAKIKRLDDEEIKNKLPLRWVYAAAAILVIVLTVNMAAWKNFSGNKKNAEVEKLIQEYGWSSNDILSN